MNKGIQTLCNFFLNFASSNPNQENFITVDVKCLVFLRFSQWTLISISRVLKTQYKPFTKPCSCKAPCQTLISSSCPHCLLLGFWELMLGYVTPLDWYPNFLMASLYSKYLFVSTNHYLDRDINVETLQGKCIWRWEILYHKNTLIKTY
jgi:hypothetical protein